MYERRLSKMSFVSISGRLRILTFYNGRPPRERPAEMRLRYFFAHVDSDRLGHGRSTSRDWRPNSAMSAIRHRNIARGNRNERRGEEKTMAERPTQLLLARESERKLSRREEGKGAHFRNFGGARFCRGVPLYFTL